MDGQKLPCPRCSKGTDEVQMVRFSLTESVPATIETAGGRINMVPQVGLPFRAYECPKCGLIEIYKKFPSQT
jgi:hypothetical protein